MYTFGRIEMYRGSRTLVKQQTNVMLYELFISTVGNRSRKHLLSPAKVSQEVKKNSEY